MTLPIKKPIQVTQPFLPDITLYEDYIDQIFKRNWLTNNGPLVQELTLELKKLFQAEHVLLVSNGTLALQVAYKLKTLSGKKVITTPFTFAATNTALAWENVAFEFCDIDKYSWNLCPNQTEDKLKLGGINAIVPVNIFGMPCDMEAFDYLSKKYSVPIIYDSAHAPLSEFKGRPIFDYGDIHCVSLHATKLLHCVEGGVIIFKHKEDYEKAKKLINFGQDTNGVVEEPGINAKLSEFHAAMGLCVAKEIESLIALRERLIVRYKEHLNSYCSFQSATFNHKSTPMYFPVQFESKQQLEHVKNCLEKNNIFPRHYFNPANLKFVSSLTIPSICNKIAPTILCLPLSSQLTIEDIDTISQIIKAS